MSSVPATDPPSNAQWTPITLSDTHPALGTLTFTFPRRMVADLTRTAPLTFRGSAPDGRAAWWPYFQQRHRHHGSFWVQGHMLNDNVHGPGTPDNLVPICSYLNTQMEALVEGTVKKLLGEGRALQYVVEAHWETGGQGADRHPEAVRKTWGLIGHDPDGLLYWGEQFAPTRLSWAVYEWRRDPMTGVLMSSPLLASSRTALARTYRGSGEVPDDTQFGNQFPGPGDLAKRAKAKPQAGAAAPAKAPPKGSGGGAKAMDTSA